MSRGALLLGAALLLSGCGATLYEPQVVARGELTLRYRDGFEVWGGGRRVARGLTYAGLPQQVRCVPVAQQLARGAVSDGRAAVASMVLGSGLGGLSLLGLTGLAVDPKYGGTFWAITGSGIGVAVTGAVFAGLARYFRNRANGQAVDAVNYYNDAVGSLGATCDDLTYPPPAGPLPPPPLAPAPAPAP